MYLRSGREYKPISSLTPDDGLGTSNTTVIGVVIHAEKPRSLNVKYATTPATKRFVFNFTLKDEQNNSINVSCWGTVEYVNPISELCFIGAAVEVINPRIRSVDSNSLYLPEVTSSLRLDCDEKLSSTVRTLTEAHDKLDEALRLAFRTPTKSNTCLKTSILDIVRDDSVYSEGTFVTIVAVVVEVNPIVEYNGKERFWHRQEIKLLDHTSKDRYLSLVLWDSVMQEFAKNWIPCKTVLQLTRGKIGVERQTNRRIICLTPRSVVTCDPLTEEGNHLARFANQLSMNSAFLTHVLQSEDQRPLFKRNLAIKIGTVAALHQFICRINSGCREQAILTCYVTNFSLYRAIVAKCGHCGKRVGIFNESQGSAPLCLGDACKNKEPQHELHYDIGVSVSDSSGMVKLLRLKDEAAVQILQIQPAKVLTLTEREKKLIEDRFWLERCEIGVLVDCRSNGSRTVDILHLRPLVA